MVWRPTRENSVVGSGVAAHVNQCNQQEEVLTQLVQELRRYPHNRDQYMTQILNAHQKFLDSFDLCVRFLEPTGVSTGELIIPDTGYYEPPAGTRMALYQGNTLLGTVHPGFAHLELILSASSAPSRQGCSVQ